MTRHYFKDKKPKNKLFDFAQNNGADYIEEDNAVWKMPKKYGEFRLAIRINKGGKFSIGTINETCDNFETDSIDTVYSEEAKWLIKMLPLVQKYKNKKSTK